MRPDSRYTRSPDSMDIYGEADSNINVNKTYVSERGAVLVIIAILSIIAGIALVRAEAAKDQAQLAEREARVLQERVADMKVELIRRGIPVSDH